MNQNKDELLNEYGELLAKFDASKDYFERKTILMRMNAINKIIGMPEKKMTTLKDIVNDNS